MLVVPTRTGCLAAWRRSISSATAKYFSFAVRIDDVGVFDALHDAVGGDDDDVELVDGVELGGFGFGGAGHAGELFVEAEVVLEGDGGEGLILFADLDAFLGFDGLMEAVGPAAAGHEAAGELVDDDDFAVLDDVLDVALVEGVGLDGDFDVVLHVPVFGVGDVADAEKLFDLLEAFVGDGDGAGFFVDYVIAGPGFGFEGLDELALFELRNDLVGDGVFVGGLVGGAGDDEGGAGFVDEDGIDFVDDAVEVAALDLVGELELHVVAEVVEAELVVGAVGDVGAVGFAALLVGEVVDDDADGEAEEAVDLAHPLGVALGEIVVDGDDVDAVAGEGVEVAGEGGDEGLAFAGLHLGDLALVEDHAADHLDVEVAHADDAAAGFADYGEGFGEDVVEAAFSAAMRASSSVMPSRAAAMRARNSVVLAESCSSVSCWMDSSKALIWASTGSMRLTARSLEVPKTLARVALNTVGSFGGGAEGRGSWGGSLGGGTQDAGGASD